MMFMLRGDSFVDLAYLHKRDLQECAVLQKAEDGTGADRVIDTRSHADGQNGGEQESRILLIYSPFCRARKVRKRHTGNTRRHSGDSTSVWQHSGSAWECSRHSVPMQPDTWATMAYHCDTSRNHIGSHGALLHHGDGNLSEAFSNRKIDEANQRVISFVKAEMYSIKDVTSLIDRIDLLRIFRNLQTEF